MRFMHVIDITKNHLRRAQRKRAKTVQFDEDMLAACNCRFTMY